MILLFVQIVVYLYPAIELKYICICVSPESNVVDSMGPDAFDPAYVTISPGVVRNGACVKGMGWGLGVRGMG